MLHAAVLQHALLFAHGNSTKKCSLDTVKQKQASAHICATHPPLIQQTGTNMET